MARRAAPCGARFDPDGVAPARRAREGGGISRGGREGAKARDAGGIGGNAWTYGHTEVLGGDLTWDVQSGTVSLSAAGARSPVSRYGSTDPSRDGPRPEELDAWTDALETVTSPMGEVTQWTFGLGGAIARADLPNGGVLTRTFGADLRVATETRAFGTTLTFGYDAAGRVTSRTGTDGSAQAFTYGAGNRLATITDGTGTTTYHHDAAGRLSGLDYPSQLGFEQQWDPSDRIEAVRVHADPAVDPRVFESTHTYDAAGNLETVTDPFGRTTTYTYDANNRLATETRPNGVTSTHSYDARGWVTSIVHADALGAVIASVAYVRAPSGEPTRITREDGSYVLVTYDAALRVERERYYDGADVLEEELAYTYDADGNRTSRSRQLGGAPAVIETYVYGPGSELLRVEVGSVPTQEFTYDAGGRVTRIERDGRDLALTYDADDHVVAIEDVGAGETTRFGFGAEGRRTSRQVFAGVTLLAAMAFATAPGLASGLDSPHLSDDGAGMAEAGYVYEGEHALARFDAGSTEPVYYLRDAMGSVIGLADATSTARIHYDGFGNDRRSDGALAALPDEGAPRFQGMWSEGSGLYYVRARSYDPATGRFSTRDPALASPSRPESAVPYAFAGDSPYLYSDPTGRVFGLGDLSVSATIRNVLSTTANASVSYGLRFLHALQTTGITVLTLARGLPDLLRAATRSPALLRASEAAFAAARQVQAFVVPNKHLPGAAGTWARFAGGVDIHAAIREALLSPGARFLPNTRPDSVRVVVDLGRVIGERGETAVRVVIGLRDGRIWTAFPVRM